MALCKFPSCKEEKNGAKPFCITHWNATPITMRSISWLLFSIEKLKAAERQKKQEIINAIKKVLEFKVEQL